MKNLILLFSLSSMSIVFGQGSQFSDDLPTNIFYDQTSPRDVAMLNNDVYFFHKKIGGNKLYIDKYEQSNSTWYQIDSIQIQQLIDFKVRRNGAVVYIMSRSLISTGPANQFELYKYTVNSGLTGEYTSVQSGFTMQTTDGASQWVYELASGVNQHMLAMTLQNASVDTYFQLIRPLNIGNEFSSSNITPFVNTLTPTILTVPQLQISSTNTDVFVLSYKPSDQYAIRISSPLNGSNFVYAGNDLTPGNEGKYNINNNPIINSGIVIGDGLLKQSYLDTLLTTPTTGFLHDFNILNSSVPTTNNVYIPNLGNGSFATTNQEGFAFIAGNAFWNTGAVTGKLRVARKQYALGANTDQPLQLLLSAVNADDVDGSTISNGIKLTLDNGLSHLALDYFTTSPSFLKHLKVYNAAPELSSSAPTNNICAGVTSVLCDDFKILDADKDIVQISSFLNTNNVTNLTSQYLYTDVSGFSHFRISGIVSAAPASYDVQVTDGYMTALITADQITAVSATNPALVTFLPTPALKFCDNETNLALSQFVTYQNGSFTLDGTSVVSGFVNVAELPANGTVQYSVEDGGCLYSITGTYEVVSSPIMGVILATGTCANTFVDATGALSGGTPPFSYQWNNGITSLNLGAVPSGDYTCMTLDANNCKATGTAIFSYTDAIVSDAVTTPSCPTDSNGTIDLTIINNLGATIPATVVWSNGMSGTSIADLPVGDYVAYISTTAGCEFSYVVNMVATTSAPSITLSEIGSPNCTPSGTGAIQAIITPTIPAAGSYTYEWNNLPSASASAATLIAGKYVLSVTNNGCVFQDSINLNDAGSMVITETLTKPACGLSNGKIQLAITPPPIFPTATVANINWSNNAEVTPFLLNLTASNYDVEVTSNLGCKSFKSFNLGYRAPLEQPICMVTVDTLSTTNLVVWEKVESIGIDYYKIYREDLTAGLFGSIDTVDFSNLSVFNDVIAGADDRSWRYRVSAVNTCGVEGPISVGHKTVHLSVSYPTANPGFANLSWDNYEGFFSPNYKIYRKSATSWTEIALSANGAVTYQDNFGAAGITQTDVDYIVAPNTLPLCSPTKANSYRYSRSNKQKGITNPGDGTGDSNNDLVSNDGSDFNVYPNPTSNEFVLVKENDENSNYSIVDQSGKVLLVGKTAGINTTIEIAQFAQGIYFLRLENNPKIIKLIKK
jgi:fibronectin type 3 domain-containing protein